MRRLALLAFLTAMVLALATGSAAAAPSGLQLHASAPTQVVPGRTANILVWLVNNGEAPISGTVTLTDTFPSELQPVDPEGGSTTCTLIGQESVCEVTLSELVPGGEVHLTYLPVVEPTATGTFGNRLTATGAGLRAPAELDEEMQVSSTLPPFRIDRFETEILDGSGAPSTVAGTAPYAIETGIGFSSVVSSFGGRGTYTSPTEHLRDAVVHLPAGLIGNPFALTARCTSQQLAAFAPGHLTEIPHCPPESQVGTIRLVVGAQGEGDPVQIVPLYSLAPPPGYPATFGFSIYGIAVDLLARLRPSDYGVDIVADKTVTTLQVDETETTFWGVPYDARHDHLRGLCMSGKVGNDEGKSCPTEAPVTPFLRLPTSCTGTPSSWSLGVETYESPGVIHSAETTTPPTTGCEQVPFTPDLSVATSTKAAGAPTGLDTTITLPQGSSPEGRAEADLRRAEISFPQGVAINPAAAAGLSGCSDAQLHLGVEGPAECPDSSKVGSLTLTTPLLDHPLTGSVFIRSQGPGTPQSGDLYRVALEVRSDEDGVDVKLPGQLRVDPATGQLTTVFDELPQLPFESVQVHLDAGPRAPLTLPGACGTYETQATFTGWNGKVATARPRFTVDQDCTPPPFSPGFEAGVVNPTAGRFSTFSLRVTRDPGMPNLSRIDATLPEGELAKLAGVAVCPEPASVCPSSSRIGTVVAGIGDGPEPLFLPQPGKSPTAVYLAGPYRGAPYSLISSVPAQAGPFDLGMVTVRSQLRLDPNTSRASVLSDPLPQIHEGIPVSYRDVRVQVDRPSFALNPTDCEPQAVTGTLTSTGGEAVPVAEHFQATDCAALGFKPKLSLRLEGKVNRTAHPRLIATLRARPGDANIARAQVKLPPAAFLDNTHIGTVCTRPQFVAHNCPAGALYGKAVATTPLLDYSLAGGVYLRSNPAHKLPDLVADLRGPGATPIEIALAGKTDSVKAALRNTFEAVPDAPVSTFRLELFGGKRGLIEMSEGFCSRPRATVNLDGQNGRFYDTRPRVKAKCPRRHHTHGH